MASRDRQPINLTNGVNAGSGAPVRQPRGESGKHVVFGELPQTPSPCRSINRLVSGRFATNFASPTET